MFRRFGSLAFTYRQPIENRMKLQDSRLKGIFLGYSRECNSYLVGYWAPRAGKLTFDVIRSGSARFTDLLVRNIDDLRPDPESVTVSMDELRALGSAIPDTVRVDLEQGDDVFLSENSENVVRV